MNRFRDLIRSPRRTLPHPQLTCNAWHAETFVGTNALVRTAELGDGAVVTTGVERHRVRVKITGDGATRRATFRTAVWRVRRMPSRILQVGGVILVIAGVLLAPFGGSYLSWLLVLGGLLWIATPTVVVHRMLRAYDRVRRPLMTYEIDETGVAASDDVKNLGYGWTAFTSVERLPDQVLFRLGRLSFAHLRRLARPRRHQPGARRLIRSRG